uniref:Uncharacterized protein n=1 Tax=Panthera leo TaxID=9689 RepID=A0A8C8Y3T5_PANLE
MVHVRPVSANSSNSSPSKVQSKLDLQRVQTLVEFPGSRLSPGAQQLMNTIRFQRQNCIPVGKRHRPVLGNKGSKRTIDLQSSSTSGALHESPSTPFPFPFPFRTGLTSETVTGDLNASIEKKCKIVPQNHPLLENDLKNAISSFLAKKASDNSDIPNSALLSFLQNLCSLVNHLCVGHSRQVAGKHH